MPEFQHIRLSPAHPRVHLAYMAITEENKADHRCTYCGIGLRADSLLNLKERVTCERCLAKLRARQSAQTLVRARELRTPRPPK